MKLDYEEMVKDQKYWQKSEHLSAQQKKEYVALADKLMQRTRENGNEVDGVELWYPEDCSNWTLFTDFAVAMGARVSTKDGGGAKMTGWFLYHQLEVE